MDVTDARTKRGPILSAGEGAPDAPGADRNPAASDRRASMLPMDFGDDMLQVPPDDDLTFFEDQAPPSDIERCGAFGLMPSRHHG